MHACIESFAFALDAFGIGERQDVTVCFTPVGCHVTAVSFGRLVKLRSWFVIWFVIWSVGVQECHFVLASLSLDLCAYGPFGWFVGNTVRAG